MIVGPCSSVFRQAVSHFNGANTAEIIRRQRAVSLIERQGNRFTPWQRTAPVQVGANQLAPKLIGALAVCYVENRLEKGQAFRLAVAVKDQFID